MIRILRLFKYCWAKTIHSIIPQQVFFNLSTNRFKKRYIGHKSIFEKNINILLSQNDKERIINCLNGISSSVIPETIKSADSICNHEINLFGKIYFLGKEINWQKDVISGYEWSLDFFRDLKIIDLNNSSDVKFPWELNRFFHTVELGKAYWYSGDEKYTEEFESEIKSWILNNPINKGINWNCSMEVGIRAVNLIWTYLFFIDSKRLSDKFHALFINLIYAHGNHIYKNLENTSYINGNHYIANLLGLLYISSIFPVFKSSKKWYKFAVKEIIKTMGEQVNVDGTNFEASIPYHRLVTEMFLHAAILVGLFNAQSLKQNSTKKNLKNISENMLGKQYIQRLERMCEFVFYYSKPDGSVPQIGDNDNGRLVGFGINKGAINDHRHILAVAGEFFDRDDFRYVGKNSFQDAIWLFKGNINLTNEKKYIAGSQGFPEAGIYVMREDRDYLIIRCSGLGTGGKGTHTHNDNLSFELCVDGITFIADPGTYTYSRDPQLRNLFRSTSYHNTLLIDDHEQNGLSETDIFLLHKRCETKVLNWSTSSDQEFFSGECRMNIKGNEWITHQRDVLFDKINRIWKIKDIISGDGFHDLNWYFHANKGVSIIVQDDIILFKNHNDKILSLFLDNIYARELKDGWYSPSYNIKERAQILLLRKRVESPFECNFSFRMN